MRKWDGSFLQVCKDRGPGTVLGSAKQVLVGMCNKCCYEGIRAAHDRPLHAAGKVPKAVRNQRHVSVLTPVG